MFSAISVASISGLADLDDVQGHFTLVILARSPRKLLDVGALLADHHARTGVWIVTRARLPDAR